MIEGIQSDEDPSLFCDLLKVSEKDGNPSTPFLLYQRLFRQHATSEYHIGQKKNSSALNEFLDLK